LPNANYRFQFQRQTFLGFFGNLAMSVFAPLTSARSGNRDYLTVIPILLPVSFFKQVTLNGEIGWGTDTNSAPLLHLFIFSRPFLANSSYAQIYLTCAHGKTHRDNTYLLTRLRSLNRGPGIFDNHIIRSKWNYQFTREFSLRFIGQYAAVLANRISLRSNDQKLQCRPALHLPSPSWHRHLRWLNSNLQNLDPASARIPTQSPPHSQSLLE